MAKKLIGFRFDDTAEAAVAQAEKMAGALIVEITKETEKNIRNLIATAISEGIPVYDAARTIVPLIGLTSAQGQAVLKYRGDLIDRGLSLDTVNSKVDRYADELLNKRADNIARTEILDALNTAQDEAWQQAQDQGFLSENATKELILSDDACEICQAIADEGTISLNGRWSQDGPPFHPQCRCTIGISQP